MLKTSLREDFEGKFHRKSTFDNSKYFLRQLNNMIAFMQYNAIQCKMVQGNAMQNGLQRDK